MAWSGSSGVDRPQNIVHVPEIYLAELMHPDQAEIIATPSQEWR
jgi:hypothetical protein